MLVLCTGVATVVVVVTSTLCADATCIPNGNESVATKPMRANSKVYSFVGG
jgi:hypothetical protein